MAVALPTPRMHATLLLLLAALAVARAQFDPYALMGPAYLQQPLATFAQPYRAEQGPALVQEAELQRKASHGKRHRHTRKKAVHGSHVKDQKMTLEMEEVPEGHKEATRTHVEATPTKEDEEPCDEICAQKRETSHVCLIGEEGEELPGQEHCKIDGDHIIAHLKPPKDPMAVLGGNRSRMLKVKTLAKLDLASMRTTLRYRIFSSRLLMERKSFVQIKNGLTE